jgi:3-(3-hydroxy-phenyl)propionate hydroxylase
MDSFIHDVGIVGLGPTGAMLAQLLSEQGLSVLCLDREADVYALPRAIHLDAETVRVFQTAGLAKEMSEHLFAAPGAKFINGEGRELHVRNRPTEPGPQGWHGAYRFHQPTVERMLRARLAQRPDVTTLLRRELFSVQERAEHVELGYEDTPAGRLGHSKVRYVVGCDGARSTVRRFLGTELEDLESHERWLVVDVVLKRPRPELSDYGIQFCNPARPATYIRGVGDRRRWEFMLKPGEDGEAIKRPESIWQLLSPWITPEDADLERPAVYTFHSVVARGWRRGRLLIAGDAAHQTPPFLGQGMCAGIRDASNLAWKLGAVIRGEAEDVLLDSYESERAPHVRTLIEAAVKLGCMIQTTDPAIAAARDINLASNPGVFAPPEPVLGPGIHDGVGPAGTIAPQPRLSDGRLLDDHIGYKHALLVHSSDHVPGIAGRDIVVISDPALQSWLAELNVKAVLLRPDRYVAGVASETNDIAALVQRVLPAYSPADLVNLKPDIRLTHVGLFARDMGKMEDFYTRVLGFTVTDRGQLQGPVGLMKLIFMSRDPAEHHQIVLVSGRPEEVGFNVINQISMKAANLGTLREMLRRMTAEGSRDIAPRTHGNAVSLYARDPEGNRLEFYVDLPWYASQPVGVPIDLTLDDDALMTTLEKHVRSLPGFKPRDEWRAEMALRMGIA